MISNFSDVRRSQIQKLITPSIDIIVLIDIIISSYFFFFNTDRSSSTGIWLILFMQVLFLPVIILLTWLKEKIIFYQEEEYLRENIGLKRGALSSNFDLSEKEMILKAKPNITKELLKNLIIGIFILDLVIAINFISFSVILDNTRLDTSGDQLFNFIILQQAYYLTPAFLFTYFYLRIESQKKLDLLYTQIDETNTKRRMHFFRSINLSRKRIKIQFFGALFIILLSLSFFNTANKNEDNQDEIYDLVELTEFSTSKIHSIWINNGKIDIIAEMSKIYDNGFRTTHLVHLTLDPALNKIIYKSVLLNYSRGHDFALDTAFDASGNYYVIIFNNQKYTYTVYHYKIQDKVFQRLKKIDFQIENSYEYLEGYVQFKYILSPFDNGVHLIQTTPVSSVVNTTIFTITIDKQFTSTKIDLFILDMLVIGGQSHVLHFSPNSEFRFFELTSFEGTGPDFTTSQNSSQLLPAAFSELKFDLPTPNSATLFSDIENNIINLYYRSINNIYSISENQSYATLSEFISSEFAFAYRGLRGSQFHQGFLYLNSEKSIDIYDTSTTRLRSQMYGKNAGYSAKPDSINAIFENSLISSDIDGRLFFWPYSLSTIENQQATFRNYIITAFSLIILGSVWIFILRRKINVE